LVDADYYVVSLSTLEHQHLPDAFSDFRLKTVQASALLGVLFLAPFATANVILGHVLLGLGTLWFVILLAGLGLLARQGVYSKLALLILPPMLAFLALSIQEQGVIGVMWAYPGVFVIYLVFRQTWAWFANAAILATVGFVAFQELEVSVALRALITLAVVSVFLVMAVRIIDSQQQELEEVAMTDSLTGLLNRNLLVPTLQQARSRAKRTNEPACLLILDIDYFKDINDTFGHIAGDEVLRGVAEQIRERLRESDQVFRVGGEEFAIVLPDTDAEPGHHVAQMLRSAIAGHRFIEDHPVTASVGIAQLSKTDDPQTWLHRADRCLYDAKRKGRNQVVADRLVSTVGVTAQTDPGARATRRLQS